MPQMEHIGNNIWTKSCSRCQTELKVIGTTWNEARNNFIAIHFEQAGGGTKTIDQMQSQCRSCRSDRNNGRTSHLHRDDMLIDQDGKCYLCEKPISFPHNARVDHCHKTGATRKIICGGCNIRMGGIDDDEWLVKAIAYRDLHRG